MPDDIALPAMPRPAEPGWVVLALPKTVLVLTRAEFIRGLRRGKGWKREQAMAARMRPDGQRPQRTPRTSG
jgi:hypothetical protein